MAHRSFVVSATIYAGSLLCFFLPFATISCGGQPVLKLTGQQLALGTTLEQKDAFGREQSKRIDAEPHAAGAFVCCIAGLALSFAGRRWVGATALCGVAGATGLLMLRQKLTEEIRVQGQGMFQVQYETGLTLAVLLLLAATGWSAYFFFRDRTRQPVDEILLVDSS